MADDRQQQRLQLYIERVTALQAERGRALELHDMKEIARELGMSEEDIAAADSAARAHLDRGLRHSSYGRWDDAIVELREAAALDPMNVEVLHALALSHKERWLAVGDPEDRRQAAELARQSVALDPAHDPSYLLLNDLDKPRQGGGTDPAGFSPRRRRGGWIALAVALLLLLVPALVLLVQRNRKRLPDPPSPSPAVVLDQPPQLDPGTIATQRELAATWEGTREDGIDLRFYAAGREGEDLVIRNVGSEDVEEILLRLDGPAGDNAKAIDALADRDGSLDLGESMVLPGMLSGRGDVRVVVLSASDDD